MEKTVTGREANMELLEIILGEVRSTRAEQQEIRKELNTHIKDEAIEFREIRKDINCLKTQTAVHKAKTDVRHNDEDKHEGRQAGFINAAISAFVAGVVSFFAIWLGGKQ